jgi:lambda family phage portal protein
LVETLPDNRFADYSKYLDSRISYEARPKMGASYGSYPYSQAFNSGTRSGGSKWPYGLSASGNTLTLNHFTMRQNARDAYHDNAEARAIVDRYADTVVDIGLMLEPTPKFEMLGITAEQAEKWSETVASAFDSWARSKKQHRAEQMTFYQAQRLYEIFQQRDNDIFVRLFYSASRNLLNPLQFSFIDPNQIRGYAFTSTYAQYSNVDGINRDERGREKSYNIWYIKPGTQYNYDSTTIPRKGAKSGRVFMLHGFAPEYAGQHRGYSRLAHALQDFENLTDFSSAHIKKAINQSNITMYTKPSQNNPASSPFEGVLTNHGAGPAVEQFGSNPNPAVDAENVGDIQRVSYCPLPEATLATPGSVGVFNLEEGEDLRAFESSAPSESYDKFVDAFTSYLAASMSMPLEVLLMKFNQNYSASRGALLLFWRVAQIWREEMGADFLNPIYEQWLSEEIAAGRISAPGWSDPRMRSYWLTNRWIGAPMPNIDPLRTSKADKEYVEMGAQTLDRVARNLNGSSGKANRMKLSREFQELPPSPWAKNGNPNESRNEKD